MIYNSYITRLTLKPFLSRRARRTQMVVVWPCPVTRILGTRGVDLATGLGMLNGRGLRVVLTALWSEISKAAEPICLRAGRVCVHVCVHVYVYLCTYDSNVFMYIFCIFFAQTICSQESAHQPCTAKSGRSS